MSSAAVVINTPNTDTLLTPHEAAEMLAVNPKTLARWSGANKIQAVRTLGGHRRYRLSDVHAILEGTI